MEEGREEFKNHHNYCRNKALRIIKNTDIKTDHLSQKDLEDILKFYYNNAKYDDFIEHKDCSVKELGYVKFYHCVKHKVYLNNDYNFDMTLNMFLKAITFFAEKKQCNTYIEQLKDCLKDSYCIKYGYYEANIKSIVLDKVENELSLQEVAKYYNQNDIGKALAELRKITEFSNEKNEKFKNFILSQGEDLREMCKKVYKFITTYENHLAENAGASDTEAQIWFDLGLSIYRLYLMNSK